MSTPRWSSACIFLSGLFAVTGCDEASAPAELTSGISFNYTGALHGQFRAAGPATVALNPSRSFAVAFRSDGGELQLCAYQAIFGGQGNFLLLNAGVTDTPGEYALPPEPAPSGTGYQQGTFLVGVDSARTSIHKISPLTHGSLRLEEVNPTMARGTFTVTTHLAQLTDGQFDVPMARLSDLPVLCQ
jgi:hypothetical protein